MKVLYIHVSDNVGSKKTYPKLAVKQIFSLLTVEYVVNIALSWVPSLARSPADVLQSSLLTDYGFRP